MRHTFKIGNQEVEIYEHAAMLEAKIEIHDDLVIRAVINGTKNLTIATNKDEKTYTIEKTSTTYNVNEIPEKAKAVKEHLQNEFNNLLTNLKKLEDITKDMKVTITLLSDD